MKPRRRCQSCLFAGQYVRRLLYGSLLQEENGRVQYTEWWKKAKIAHLCSWDGGPSSRSYISGGTMFTRAWKVYFSLQWIPKRNLEEVSEWNDQRPIKWLTLARRTMIHRLGILSRAPNRLMIMFSTLRSPGIIRDKPYARAARISW